MAKQTETRKRSKIGAPLTQIPIMVDSLGSQSSSQIPNAPSKNNMHYRYMNRNNLSQLTKEQLIELLIASQRPVPMPRTKKVTPVPKPRQSVQQMIQNYETNIIKPIPAPRMKKRIMEKPIPVPRRPIPKPRKKKVAPIPKPRTQITQLRSAFHKFTNSYEIGIKNVADPLVQLSETRLAISQFLTRLLTQSNGIKFMETMRIYFEKEVGKEKTSKVGYFVSKPKTVMNTNNLPESLDINVEEILNGISNMISEGSAWIVKAITGHYLNVTKYEPLTGSSYIELPTELQKGQHGLINLKNKDNECFRWCHVRHLNPRNDNPQRIKKTDKAFMPQLNYEGIEFPVSVKQYNKVETQNNININVFGYENKQTYPIYVSKEKFENTMNLLLISDDEKNHYVYIKDFNRFMHHKTKSHQRKHFCMHCLQCFSSERVLNKHKEVCIEINGENQSKCLKLAQK